MSTTKITFKVRDDKLALLVAILVRLMLGGKITPDDIRKASP
jgi:hypothetical protein